MARNPKVVTSEDQELSQLEEALATIERLKSSDVASKVLGRVQGELDALNEREKTELDKVREKFRAQKEELTGRLSDLKKKFGSVAAKPSNNKLANIRPKILKEAQEEADEIREILEKKPGQKLTKEAITLEAGNKFDRWDLAREILKRDHAKNFIQNGKQGPNVTYHWA